MLLADVKDLQGGLDSIEERARNELGLVKQNEVFFRLVAKQGKK
jgi:cell division protein FtsB